jgi:O-acetylhomoserine/O-acetylserine sulfhydrylase-like pyridoxal-dependent enzyme
MLDNGIGAIATASGQAAMHLAIVTLVSAGEHIVASRSIYGGSHNLLDYTLRRFGIDTTIVDPSDPQAFADAIQDNTRLVFSEILGNPGLEVLNVPEVARVAHEAGLPLMVDATFTTPYLCRPIDLGADIVMHSATKFLSGHGIVIGGLIVDEKRRLEALRRYEILDTNSEQDFDDRLTSHQVSVVRPSQQYLWSMSRDSILSPSLVSTSTRCHASMPSAAIRY